MRTVLVNPMHASRARSGGGSLVVVRNNPSRRRRRARTRARRRNPALPSVPVMVANPRRRRRSARNPLVLPNRPRRRRRRNPAFDLNRFLKTAMTGVVSGGGVYLVNKFAISRLGVDEAGNDTQYGLWIRQAARVVLGGLAAHFMPGEYGAAINGAMMYPLSAEFDAWWSHSGGVGGVPSGAGGGLGGGSTSASLLEADLHDVLDGIYSGR